MLSITTLADINALRESSDIECKLAQGRDGQGRLPHDIWETYSAFANTRGGDILLGLEEYEHQRFRLMGIEKPDRVLSEFWRHIKNPEKTSVCIIGEENISVITIEGKNLIHIHVPVANHQQRPVYIGNEPFTGSYERINSGDIRIDKNRIKRLLDNRYLQGK